MSKKEIIREIYAALQYHKSLGIEFYPESEGLNEFLNFECQSQAVVVPTCPDEATAKVATVQAVPVAPSPEPSVPTVQPHMREKSDGDICAECGLRQKRIGFVEGKGGKNVRLLVVGDWLAGAEQMDSISVFGAEQDLMLARMFAAMKLPASDVFVTNIIKCALPADVRPEPHQIRSCMNVLYRQIIDLQPQVICTMGSVASQAILKKSQSLSQLRGKFYQVEFDEGLVLPVLATYHPTYLLKNVEMKRPAWDDLQKVVQRLSAKQKSGIRR